MISLRHDVHDLVEEGLARLGAADELVPDAAVLEEEGAAGVARGKGVVSDHDDRGTRVVEILEAL